ncbi:MAG TPA: RES family NAD+ phosphorylase, partial [Thermoanaerobaculia bacterium]|nr:RES family NAD+ phosphorylase [Thermoanaerobaculia bacterium]
LKDFPERKLSPEIRFFRVVRRGRGPWWFGNSMQGRFDLPEPHGTCYVAADELAALLEVIAADREGARVSSEFVAQRGIRELQVPNEVVVSDLTSRRASGFGITAEIGTTLPYDRPQAWAASLHEAGFLGIVYWLRHDPSRAEGIALFGLGGERKRWRRGRELPISAELIERLQAECGIEVVPIPSSKQLRILDEE